MTDRDALDFIAIILSAREWTADTCSQIADIVRATGRRVDDLPEVSE